MLKQGEVITAIALLLLVLLLLLWVCVIIGKEIS